MEVVDGSIADSFEHGNTLKPNTLKVVSGITNAVTDLFVKIAKMANFDD